LETVVYEKDDNWENEEAEISEEKENEEEDLLLCSSSEEEVEADDDKETFEIFTGEEEETSVSQSTRVSSIRTRNAVIERKTTINAVVL
jgi:hypothetical protein